MRNAEIADAFAELADLYELDGAIVHRVVAYRTAARTVREAPLSVAALAAEGRATELSGIGGTLQDKIRTLTETGEIPSAQKLRAKFPAGLIEMTRNVPGLGPKRARVLYEELGLDSVDALREAAVERRIRTLRGFGAKAEENILAALASMTDGEVGTRTLLHRALAMGDAIVDALRAHPAAERVELAGSARRMSDSVKDLDVIATAKDPRALAQALTELDVIESAGSAGEAGVRARTHTAMPVDMRVVEPDQFGNLLQHFTGSKEHNMRLREAAVRKGLHVSEYGIKDDATGETHRCATEEEVYALLGYDYIPPELREGRGELDAAREGGPGLPRLITADDIRGELHSHTTASDGRASIETMARAAAERGLEYLAITDHSATHGFGNDVSADELRRHIERVREQDARMDGFTLLAGSEVNVLPDGSLDYDDDLLAELDWVVASLHSSFGLSESEMTERMVRAIEHPLVDTIGHPTGRLIGRREPYALDLERIVEAAAGSGTFLEVNANPNRRDLHEGHARMAAAAGVRLTVDSDAHGVETLEKMRYGIATARRGWLTPEDVANTRSWPELDALRKRAS